MNKKIWIVTATCGEYSDRSEWNVIAYDNEEAAKLHVIKAQEVSNVIYEHNRKLSFMNNNIKKNPYDEDNSSYYRHDETSYSYHESELLSEVKLYEVN